MGQNAMIEGAALFEQAKEWQRQFLAGTFRHGEPAPNTTARIGLPSPAPAGGRARVGIWCPCLLDGGGAETWQLALARSVDPDRVAWQGCAITMGRGMARPAALAAMGDAMPVLAGPDRTRPLAARCEVLVTWAGIDPAPILAGLADPPRVVFALHMPARGYGGRLPVPARSIDRFVAVSELCLDLVPDAPVIWNAVDPARLQVRRGRAETRRTWGVPGDAPTAGFLGRLAPEKDAGAMARLAGALPDPWHVVVVGEGPTRAGLAAHGPTRLHVVGPDPSPGDVLNAFDILVVPSLYESFGLSLAEGLWMGVPVVATDTGVNRLAPGYCRTIPAGADGATLAAAVLADAADPAGTRARADLGRAFARSRFSLDRLGREWSDLLCREAEIHRRLKVARCPDRGGVLPLSLQDDCGCRGKELSGCRAGRGKIPGRVTVRDCLDCVTAGDFA